MNLKKPHLRLTVGKRGELFGGLFKNSIKTWNFLLLLFAALNILILALNFYLFVKISGDEVFVQQPEVKTPGETIKRSDLESLIKEIDNRKSRSDELQTGGSDLIDPSS